MTLISDWLSVLACAEIHDTGVVRNMDHIIVNLAVCSDFISRERSNERTSYGDAGSGNPDWMRRVL